MTRVPYRLSRPAQCTTSVVFASPHSGRDYQWSFLRKSVLDERVIRSSEDAFVDILFEKVPEFGAPLLCATEPRAWLDLNRGAEELDWALIDGAKRSLQNPRIASGLGVIPRVVASGRAIYRGKLSLKEAEARIERVWKPYHDRLQGLIDQAKMRFDEAILIDCHSMPHEAIDAVHRHGQPRPDVVLGDRYGASADTEIIDRIESAFLSAGLRVARNAPFAGAYIAQHYGRPSRRQHAVQVEIDRSLYMNEQMIRPNGNFAAFQKVVTGIAADIAEIGRRGRSAGRALAAE